MTIDQASGQADPTSTSPIYFTAVFSEPVTDFTNSDVTLSSTAGVTTADVIGGPTTFDVAISGMTSDGTVIASIPANAAQDTALNGNTASTSTDNTVTFVVASNSPPTAVADSYTTNEDAPLSVGEPGVLANDTDPDSGNMLKAVLVSGPTHAASFTLNENGSFDYTPSANFSGSDSFTYKASDGSADSNEVSVAITVNAVNDAPTVEVAAGGSCGTNDRSGTINLTVKDPDGPAGSLTLGGTFSNTALVPTSNVSFGGTGADRTLTATAVSGRIGTAVLTVTVTDGQQATGAPLTVNVRVGGNGNDTLVGDANSDILLGQNGDDTLSGLGGIDLLCGARGNDRLTGGALADHFGGGQGTDVATDFDASPQEGDTKDTTIP